MTREQVHTRRTALLAAGSVVAVGLGGCSTSEPSDPSRPAETPTSSPTATEHEHAHQPTETEPPDSAQFLENPEEVHPTVLEETSVAADEVLIGLRLEDSSLPFRTEVYRAPEGAEIHATETYDTHDLDAVDLVPDPPRALDTVETEREPVHYGTTTVGEPLVVTLVARHDGDPFEWSSWSRTGYPHDGHDDDDPALDVDCYCGGEIYTAPRDGTWARVIQVTPTERVEAGTTIVLNWTSSRA